MKRISLMRHADAVLDVFPDIERPLSALGKKQATISAKHLQENYHIDLICSSTARRALETSSYIEELYPQAKIQRFLEIYQGISKEFILNLITAHSSSEHILLIGHNPSILHVVLDLLGPHNNEYENLANSKMRPAQAITLFCKEDFTFSLDRVFQA